MLRQIGDQLVAGLEQFLFVDDVVAVENGAGFVPVRSMATRSGTRARIRLRAAVRRQSWRKRVAPEDNDGTLETCGSPANHKVGPPCLLVALLHEYPVGVGSRVVGRLWP